MTRTFVHLVAFELVEYFLGPQPEEVRRARHPDDAVADAGRAGLEITDLRSWGSPRTESGGGCVRSSTTSVP